MERRLNIIRSYPSAVRAGGLDEPRKQGINQKMDQSRSDQSSASPRYRRENKRTGQRGLRKESDRLHSTEKDSSKSDALSSKNSTADVNHPEFGPPKEEVIFASDRSKQKPRDFLNFNYSQPRHSFDGSRAKKSKKQWNPSRYQVYNKEAYLQANCQFIVQEGADYTLHTVQPDLLVDWKLIEQICLNSHEIPSCPICLEEPTVARITRCGHVFCWSCILHYLHLGEKPWRKCPICYEAIIPADLKSVITRLSHRFAKGEYITMQLMKRKKGSVLSKPSFSGENLKSRVIDWQGDIATIMPSVHAKLLKASPKAVYENIVCVEMKSLEQQLKDAKSEQCGEDVFIEKAISSLKEKEKLLSTLIERTRHLLVKEEVKETISQNDDGRMMKIVNEELEKKVASMALDEAAFSDDEQEQNSVDASQVLTHIKEKPTSNPIPVAEDKQLESFDCQKRATQEVDPEFYYYYEAEDGQNIYLQPINVRCLISEYGGMRCCPPKITAQIIDMESYSMTEDLRKRYRYLSHLPLSGEFTFCELMIKQPVLSKETLRLFAEEFRQRKLSRQRKKREERSVARKIERRLAVNSFGIEVEDTPECASLDLESLEDFPSQRSESSPEDLPIRPPTISDVPVAWGSSTSFAQALQRKSQPGIPAKEYDQRKATKVLAATSNGGYDLNMDDGDCAPVPTFGMAFRNALEKHEPASCGAEQGGVNKHKKKRKEKKLLFATGSTRKY